MSDATRYGSAVPLQRDAHLAFKARRMRMGGRRPALPPAVILPKPAEPQPPPPRVRIAGAPPLNHEVIAANATIRALHRERGVVPMAKVQKTVCQHFGVSLIDMLSSRRTTRVIVPRHVAMFICRKRTFRSLPEIARAFRRDHTSILNACERIEARIATNPEFAAMVAALEASL